MLHRSGTVSATVCLLAVFLFFAADKKGDSMIRSAMAGSLPLHASIPRDLQNTSNGTSCHVGPPYTSSTSTDTIPNPSHPPTLGPAGSKLYETEFQVQNQIVRVTDETDFGSPGGSPGSPREYSVYGSPPGNRWSPDDTHFAFLDTVGNEYVAFFDPNCSDGDKYMDVTPDRFDNNSSQPPFQHVVFNEVSSQIIAYGTSGTKIQTCIHDHAAGTCPVSTLFDLSNSPKMPHMLKPEMGDFFATKDQDASVAFSGSIQFRSEPPGCTGDCSGQDHWDGVAVCVKNYDGHGKEGCAYWDTYRGNMGGDFGPQCTACPGVPQGLLLHASAINGRKSGKLSDLWVVAGVNNYDPGEYFWNVSTGSVTKLERGADGHGICGNSFFVNDANGFNRDARSWLYRLLIGLDAPIELIPSPPPPQLGRQDSHPVLDYSEQYIYSNFFSPLGNCTETTAWECENVALQTYPPEPGKLNSTVWRFIHNWSFNTSSTGDFWHSPKAEVSPDGKFMCFSSDWGDTIPGRRSDVFCNEMK